MECASPGACSPRGVDASACSELGTLGAVPTLHLDNYPKHFRHQSRLSAPDLPSQCYTNLVEDRWHRAPSTRPLPYSPLTARQFTAVSHREPEVKLEIAQAIFARRPRFLAESTHARVGARVLWRGGATYGAGHAESGWGVAQVCVHERERARMGGINS